MSESITTEFDPRDVVKAYIERERADWLPAYHRAQRAGGMSGEANAEAAAHMDRINPLLEELHALGGVAIAGSVDDNRNV